MLVVALTPRALFAQGAPADTASVPAPATPADTTALGRTVAPADTVIEIPPRPPRTVPPLHWSDQPRFVMLRSLLIPGWGQLANRAPIKAAIIAGLEGALVYKVVEDRRELDRLQEEVNRAREVGDEQGYADAVNRYNARLDTYVGRQWLLGGAILYSLIDAYVDANFRGFDVEFRADPALPSGAPSSKISARFSYRWTF